MGERGIGIAQGSRFVEDDQEITCRIGQCQSKSLGGHPPNSIPIVAIKRGFAGSYAATDPLCPGSALVPRRAGTQGQLSTVHFYIVTTSSSSLRLASSSWLFLLPCEVKSGPNMLGLSREITPRYCGSCGMSRRIKQFSMKMFQEADLTFPRGVDIVDSSESSGEK